MLHSLDRFLETLAPRDRELFVLSQVEGLTGPELTEALGGKMSTIYGRIRVLRQRLTQEVVDDAAIEQAKAERPRATASGWAALVPALKVDGWRGLGAMASTVTATAFGAGLGALVIAGAVGIRSSNDGGRRGTVTAQASTVQQEGTRREDGAAGSVQAEPASPERGSELAVMDSRGASGSPARMPVQEQAAGSGRDEPVTAVGTVGASASTTDALARENQLLHLASSALSTGDPTGALAATGAHAREFPGSPLADVRAALRIEALCAQAKHAQARGEARVFLAAHPSGPIADRVRGACPRQSREAGPSVRRLGATERDGGAPKRVRPDPS